MRAIVWEGRENVQVREVPRPRLKLGQALVQVAYCGICGSDLEEYWEGPVMLPQTPHPLSGRNLPLILGHEAVGIVAEVSSDGNPPVKVGDRVCLESLRSCGTCADCLGGHEYLCEQMVCMGLQDDGAMAEFVRVPLSACHKLPPGMPTRAGALVEPLSVVHHAWKVAHMQTGQTALIYGAGMIGLGLVRWAVQSGIRAWVVEPHAGRRDLAVALGAERAVSPTDTQEVVGADTAFECSGRAGALCAAVDHVRKGGTVVAIGIHGEPVSLNVNTLIAKQVRLLGSVGNSHGDFMDAFRWVSQDHTMLSNLVGLVTTLDSVVAEGFRRASTDLATAPKVIVKIHGGE